MKFKLIGVTGPIVSGKSTFCNFLKEYGFYHIDADTVAKTIYERPSVKLWLRKTFGSEIFGTGNILNLRTLARILFSDPQMLKKLERYLYPLVYDEVEKEIKRLNDERKFKGVAIEAIKLFESGTDNLCDVTVAIVCSRESQIERLNKKGMSFSRMLSIFNCQPTSYFFSEKCDFTIENNGSLEEFKHKCDIFLEEKVLTHGKV